MLPKFTLFIPNASWFGCREEKKKFWLAKANCRKTSRICFCSEMQQHKVSIVLTLTQVKYAITFFVERSQKDHCPDSSLESPARSSSHSSQLFLIISIVLFSDESGSRKKRQSGKDQQTQKAENFVKIVIFCRFEYDSIKEVKQLLIYHCEEKNKKEWEIEEETSQLHNYIMSIDNIQ